MPTNTVSIFASQHQLHQLRILRQVDRSLGDETHRIAVASCQAMISRKISFIAFLLPIRLSSTMNASCIPAATSPSSSAMTWRAVLSRGRRPKTTMMSQNSQVNGQPREICRLPKNIAASAADRAAALAPWTCRFFRPARSASPDGPLPLGEKSRPGLLRLADKDDIGERPEILGLTVTQGPPST